MVLRLRLARVSSPSGAKRHKPFYNIVLAQSRSARDGKPMEVLGTYNPIPQTPVGAAEGDRKVKDIKIDVSRAQYWLGVGAQPSDTVWRLLSMIGLIEPKYLPPGAEQERQRKGSLRGVRFETHAPRLAKSLGSDIGEVNPPAGTTSPENPNAVPGTTRSENPNTAPETSGNQGSPDAAQEYTKRPRDIVGEHGTPAGTTSPQDPNAA